MNLLVDSHVLLWWLSEPKRVSPRAVEALESPLNRVYVSAAVAWELSIKSNLGKLAAAEVISDLPRILFDRGFRRMAISMDHAIRAGALPPYHKDPFDRMLVAQAQALSSPIVSGDPVLDRYGITRIW